MARFTRRKPAPIVKGRYQKFRPFVREDFEECCAYCCLHEFWAQGDKGFDIDHFYPRREFEKKDPEKEKDFYNLCWSCAACNRKGQKGDRWPSEKEWAKGIRFIDLCTDDFDDHYRVLDDGTIEGLTESARWTIDAILLNRDHLIQMRAFLILRGYEMGKPPPK